MKKEKKIYLVLIFLFLIFTGIEVNTYAAVNSHYVEDSINTPGDTGNKSWLTDKLLNLLGHAFYGLGRAIQFLVTAVVKLLSSINQFPWADKVIFNGVSLLDVNFINPAKNSLFMDNSSKLTTIGTTVRNVYFTGLSISLGFLGIIVAVMAIRLAISSIGSEKAKYKEAIVHWATAIILIFGMHYLISFVFYINEQLVEVASNIVFDKTDSLPDNQSKDLGDMGNWFAENVDMDNDGTESLVSGVLFAVFVIQSVMFFWAYVKRFFFVTILALISPFVVIYDFLQKSMS